jgi:hypothetical protein
MSAPIGPGDWVECVDAAARSFFAPEDVLTVGKLYRVTKTFVNAFGPALGIEGHPRIDASAYWGFEVGYRLHRFRPIYRPKSSIIEQLKQPAPDVVRELIVAD